MLKSKFFYFLGIYLLASVVANLIKNYYNYGNLLDILWFCNIVAIILGIGILLKNRKAVTLCLVTSIPAQFMWIVDFFLELFGEGLGRTAFIMNEPLWIIILTVNLHLVIIPIAAYAVYKLGFADNILIYIILLVVVLLTSTFLFTDIDVNKNCVFYSCDVADPPHGENPYGDNKKDYLPYLFKSMVVWIALGAGTYYGFKGVRYFWN